MDEQLKIGPSLFVFCFHGQVPCLPEQFEFLDQLVDDAHRSHTHLALTRLPAAIVPSSHIFKGVTRTEGGQEDAFAGLID